MRNNSTSSHPTRRRFLQTSLGVTGGVLGIAALPRLLPAATAIPPGSAPGIRDSDVKALTLRALDAARSAGARYADIRLTRSRTLLITNSSTFLQESLHGGVRALVDGYWGFSSSPIWTAEEMARLGKEAVRQAKANTLGKPRAVVMPPTSIVTDGHWDMPVRYDSETGIHPLEILDTLAGLYEWIGSTFDIDQRQRPGNIWTLYNGSVQDKAFGSTDGSYCTQRLHGSEGLIRFNGRKGACVLDGLSLAGAGWELFGDRDLRQAIHAEVAYNNRMRKLPAKNLEVGKYDVVLDAATVAEVLGKTIGAATEIDRAYGYEANAGGTSYLADPNAMLGTFGLASPLVTITAGRDDAGGVATTKWDDEGVEPERFTLIDKGVVTDFHTSREGAGWLKSEYERLGRPDRSHGNVYAPTGADVPLIHTANLRLTPGETTMTGQDLEQGLENGIVFTRCDADIDFQGGSGVIYGDSYEVKQGKRAANYRGVASIQFRTPELWKSVMQVAGPASASAFGTGGMTNDLFQQRNAFKGEPRQIVRHTATTVPIRVKEASVIRRGAR